MPTLTPAERALQVPICDDAQELCLTSHAPSCTRQTIPIVPEEQEGGRVCGPGVPTRPPYTPLIMA